MKASKLKSAATTLALLAAIGAATASARPPREESDNDDHYAYVMVTGSNIPQKVKIKSIGTLTSSPLRVFKRHEIDQTGAFNTEDVLRHDPSITVHGFGQAGPGN
jgi:outer membrane cobalamin receptor